MPNMEYIQFSFKQPTCLKLLQFKLGPKETTNN